VKDRTRSTEFEVNYDLSDREKDILVAGGTLQYMKKRFK